jgi:hypothetical protein
MTNPAIYWIILASCSLYVLVRGGAPERIAIGIAVAASILSVTALFGSAAKFDHMEATIFVVDVATLLAFFTLSLFADRFWPLWITGIHLVGVATHAAKLLDPLVVPWAYAVTQALWSYPILLLIVIGAMRHQKRLKRFGVDNSWNGFSAAAGRMRQRRAGPTG